MDIEKLGKRIMVIGSCGGGKTTFSIKLSKILKLPLIHLDKEFWKPGWIETPKEEWYGKQEKIVSNESWIIDGNYGGSFDIRFKKANTVIFLDYNRYICLIGIFKRWLMFFGKNRIDMGEGCIEKIDWQFIKFVWDFPKKSRPNIYNKLNEYENINKIILKNRRDTDKLMKSIKVN
jgi:adenylate kinase family enzyme